MLNLAERKRVYQILSELFSYPEKLSQAGYQQYLVELSQLLQLSLPESLEQVPGLREMETAYTGLFVNSFGGTPAPPYGSVYLDPGGMLMGESSLNVAACYAAQNLNLQGSDEPPDFLATELEFLYYLLDEEEAALRAGNSARQTELKSRQAEFIKDFLSPWVPQFCDRIVANSADPFYLWVGEALQRFCALEVQQAG